MLVRPACLWQSKHALQINFLKDSGVTPVHYLLDIGRGTLRVGIPLIDHLQERHCFGIELRKEVSYTGYKELEEVGQEWEKTTPSIRSGYLIDRHSENF